MIQTNPVTQVIRKIEKRDILDIKEILENSNNFNIEEIECALDIVNTYFNNHTQNDYKFVCYEHNNRVIGYACYGPTPITRGTFDLYWICVNPEFQNCGIGTRLLREVEKNIIDSNGRLIVVETSSHEKYLSAVSFYKRNKYSIVAVIENFYCEGENKIILLKRLISQNFE